MLQKLSPDQKRDLNALQRILFRNNPKGKAKVTKSLYAKEAKISDSTAYNRLRTFEDLGFIERNKSEITWKGPIQVTSLEGPVPLDSPFYVVRKVDEDCKTYLENSFSELEERVPFLRILGSEGMGKTSLLYRLRNFLENKGCVVGFINFESHEFASEVFTSVEQLYYTFTKKVTEAFKQSVPDLTPPDLKEFWKKQEELAPPIRCTDYLNDNVFSKVSNVKKNKTLVTLFIDGLDRVIARKELHEFLISLRTWNVEYMRRVKNQKIIWPSIIVAYSTDSYVTDGYMSSPLYNVGTLMIPREFEKDEVLELAKRYGLVNWRVDKEVAFLMKLVGGHPVLINKAFYKISQEDMTLEQLDKQATLEEGPFGDYLQKYMKILHSNREIREFFKKILEGDTDTGVRGRNTRFPLIRAGLIKEQPEIKVSCELYRRYFKKHL
jgi:hypothetical protein